MPASHTRSGVSLGVASAATAASPGPSCGEGGAAWALRGCVACVGCGMHASTARSPGWLPPARAAARGPAAGPGVDRAAGAPAGGPAAPRLQRAQRRSSPSLPRALRWGSKEAGIRGMDVHRQGQGQVAPGAIAGTAATLRIHARLDRWSRQAECPPALRTRVGRHQQRGEEKTATASRRPGHGRGAGQRV